MSDDWEETLDWAEEPGAEVIEFNEAKRTEAKAKKEQKKRSADAAVVERTTRRNLNFDPWHTPDLVGYVSVPMEGRTEHFPVRSREFRRLVTFDFYRSTGEMASRPGCVRCSGQSSRAELSSRVRSIPSSCGLPRAPMTGSTSI